MGAVVAEASFRAMGSDAHLVVVGGPGDLAERARLRIDDLEQRWSRFRPDSEVSRLNRSTGQALAVSSETVELVERAVDAWRLSGGTFDPTVLGAVIRAGYDRSFDQMVAGAGGSAGGEAAGGSAGEADRPDAGAIVVDGHTVRLPAGSGFDPGGIGKGLAADMVTAETLAAGADGVCVNMGGDVRVAGTGPGGGTWTVAVEHPWSAPALVRVGLGDGAVATSTTLKRRWTSGGVERHHLIDPRTGRPSETDLNLATIVAAKAWVAEVLAKAVILAGSAHAFDVLAGVGADALVVGHDGRIRSTPGFVSYLGSVPLPGSVSCP